MPSSALIDSECQIDRRQFLTGAPRYSVFQKLHPIGEGGGEDKTLELVALMNEEVSLSLLYPAYWYTDQLRVNNLARGSTRVAPHTNNTNPTNWPRPRVPQRERR